MGIKHTPGPWYIRRMKDGKTIAEIGPICADEYAGCCWLDVREEDARLIAAAPDLLEALTDAVIDFDNWAAHEDNHPHEHLVAWAERARAAIAKAKGEEQ